MILSADTTRWVDALENSEAYHILLAFNNHTTSFDRVPLTNIRRSIKQVRNSYNNTSFLKQGEISKYTSSSFRRISTLSAQSLMSKHKQTKG